ncbi:MAG: PEP-CTERM sorting domain-containing protein [Planctomycetota bacterium]|jgi:hypothetical protein
MKRCGLGQSAKQVLRSSVLLSVSVILLVSFAASASGAVVYDNSSEYLGVHAGTAQQLGDEITLAGTERTVTELHIGVNLQGYGGTADFQAWLYANDGPGGEPGTMLWASEVVEAIPLSGENEFIVFDVPNIPVPDTFTWTQQNRNATPVAVGIPLYDPPSIGSSEVHSWFGKPGSWTKTSGVTYPGNYMCRVVAVPEPGSILLLSLGGIVLRRKRGQV